jgi:hypothetical protein
MVEILPDIGGQVQGVYQEVPKLAAGIEAIQEQLRVSGVNVLIQLKFGLLKASGHKHLTNNSTGTPEL